MEQWVLWPALAITVLCALVWVIKAALGLWSALWGVIAEERRQEAAGVEERRLAEERRRERHKRGQVDGKSGDTTTS